MGCSLSKLDDDEAVQLCKDRKHFIKQALKQRLRFASEHLAYIQSLRRVSSSLSEYVEGDKLQSLLLDALVTPPVTPVKKKGAGFITISPKLLPQGRTTRAPHKSTRELSYLRSRGALSISIEERVPIPEISRVETFSPSRQYGFDGPVPVQSSSSNSSRPQYTPNISPPSPQTPSWEGFLNPFSYYTYPTYGSYSHTAMDDEIRVLRQVREEEGIPELENETEEEKEEKRHAHLETVNSSSENFYSDTCDTGHIIIEDSEDEEEDDDNAECNVECKEIHARNFPEQGVSTNVRNPELVDITEREVSVDKEEEAETPGFTVYVNRKLSTMTEVVRDLEQQFTLICNSAEEVSTLLESSQAQYLSASHELSAKKMLNPVSLFRSASSRSSSSRFMMSSSSSRNESYNSNGTFSDESDICSSSHQSTVDRLYAWEKKLYEEVRAGERIRVAYDKKCMQLKHQIIRGEDPSVLDKTRAAICYFHTQMKVSVHSVEAISRRIETLRDEELYPQLYALAQGLARMWKVMAESHQVQKKILDEAKLLLAITPRAEHSKHAAVPMSEIQRLARCAVALESEVKSWRACFKAWIKSQRSYLRALTCWLLRCTKSNTDPPKLPLSPSRSGTSLPICTLSIQWSKFLDKLQEKPVIDGLDFFAAGMGSLHAQQLKEESSTVPVYSSQYGDDVSEPCGETEMVQVGHMEEVMNREKTVQIALRVLCAGMSVAVSSLSEFSHRSSVGYTDLLAQPGSGTHKQPGPKRLDFSL